MKNKAYKIVFGVVAGLLTLSTSAYAGFKVLNSDVVNDKNVIVPSPTPEVIEVAEEVEDIEHAQTISPSPVSTAMPQASAKGSSSSVLNKFRDDEDDDVEFEDKEDDEDEKEIHNSPRATSTPLSTTPAN